MSEPVPAGTLDEMAAYYRARAAEYDEWFYRQGRYDRGLEENARWFAEANEVFSALDALHLTGDVLELAPGTGIWTERLAATARSVTAVDSSTEMIRLNGARVRSDRVRYVEANLFEWKPDQGYDAVVFAFWLSHVPRARLDAFLRTVADALRSDGVVFFADSRRVEESTAVDHQLPAEGAELMTRKLNDGRAFQIVKNFYEPAALASHFSRAGLKVEVRETPTFFLYGSGIRVAG